MATKVCIGPCERELPVEKFHRDGSSRDGRRSRCPQCRRTPANDVDARENLRKWRAANPEKVQASSRRAYLKKAFGITPEQYDEMLAAQGGVCAICGGTESGNGKRFHVDHDHTTGAIRGILCHHCNLALGHFKDDPKRLAQAIAYLGVTPSV